MSMMDKAVNRPYSIKIAELSNCFIDNLKTGYVLSLVKHSELVIKTMTAATS